MSCGPGCRWEVRVMRLGDISQNERWWPRSIGPALAMKLQGVPVGFYFDGQRLSHRADSYIQPQDIVGIVEAAAASPGDVLATVHLVDEALALRRALLAMQRDGRLPLLGVSLVAHVDSVPAVNCGRRVERVTGIRAVVSLDFVTRPGAPGACVLRAVEPAALDIA